MSDEAQQLQEAKNRLCIDGHLNLALNAITTSRSPDEIFNLIGSLARMAVDMGWQACDAEVSQLRERVAELERDVEQEKVYSSMQHDLVTDLQAQLAARKPSGEPKGSTWAHDDSCPSKHLSASTCQFCHGHDAPLFTADQWPVPEGWKLVPKEPTDDSIQLMEAVVITDWSHVPGDPTTPQHINEITAYDLYVAAIEGASPAASSQHSGNDGGKDK